MTDTTDRAGVLIARLYRLRLDEDLTWDQTARLVGLNRSTLMQWCDGKVRAPWDRKIVRVERLFQLSEEALTARVAEVKNAAMA